MANVSTNTNNVSRMSEKQTAKNSESQCLQTLLSDTFVLYMKTYAVHWNFTGPNFFSVHKLTEQQYGELAEAIDEIAERIRAKGEVAPVSLADILSSADLEEFKKNRTYGPGDIADLAEGHRKLARVAAEAITTLEMEDDHFSADMATARMGAHEKAAWMLSSINHH